MASSPLHDGISLIIIDDHVLVAESLQLAADNQPDIRALAAARTLADGIDLVQELRPDVVLLDDRLPDGSTEDGIVRIIQASPHTAVLVLGGDADSNSVVRALESGAAGFLLKGQKVGEVFDAVRAAHAGEHPIAPQLVASLVARIGRRDAPMRHLTRREVEVLRYLAEGMTTADLSEQLQLSLNTVRNHIQSAIRRLGAHSKLEAVAIAQREGLIHAP